MFWRFGFNNGSSIDSLLDKEEVALEALLDEDDLLQECKSQNTRLIEYFGRVDVLKKLLGYVTGQTETEERGRFKYPYIATEVLCSDLWSVVETCVNEEKQLLVPFWETVLDRPPEDMKTQMVMASHFAKINSAFLTKKPAEMIAFMESQPSIVDRLLQHIETSPFVDLLVRIIQLDELAVGSGVLEWLSSQSFMGRLTDMLSPQYSSDFHSVVADLIKGIISMATPSPNTGLTDGQSNGPASNRFARELARKDSISKLLSYMLYDFDPLPEENDSGTPGPDELSLSTPSLPTRESATSSVVQSIAVVIELIRKNNSDYFEPYLFHTLRNRLIQVQQQSYTQGEDSRQGLEQVMKDMVNRMGVVHLGPVLEIMSEHLQEIHQLLKKPRSLRGPVLTTVGSIMPLTLERYRILELLAELLHCSNMALLNRPASYSHLYDSEGRLQGGLAALEELASVIALNNPNDRDNDPMDEVDDEIAPAMELPIRSAMHDSPSLDSEDDMSDDPGSSDEEMEEIAMYDEPQAIEISPFSPMSTGDNPPEPISSNSPIHTDSPLGADSSNQTLHSLSPGAEGLPPRSPGRSHVSRRNSRRRTTIEGSVELTLPIGERLKTCFLDLKIFTTLLDLFFEIPWNNFLHSTVYDLIHQVLTGNVDTGRNRELAISLFRDAKIMHRIVEGQARNDNDCTLTKGGRLGYMGHLTLIAEDVITALEHFPPELRLIIIQYAPEEEWDRYVTGRYLETKAKDTRLLGGGKPVVASRNIAQWKVDEDESSPTVRSSMMSNGGSPPGIKGEFRRGGGGGGGGGPSRNTANFGPASVGEGDSDDDDEESSRAPHFAHYLEQEMNSDHLGSSSDEDDDDEGWLSQSNFSHNNPPVTARHQNTERRPLSAIGFDDTFDDVANAMTQDAFSPHDNDGFGPFSDAASASGSDPFTFSSSFSDEMEDSSFESFGDFGDFQAAEEGDGELTPTTGSWTFASDSTTSISDESDIPVEPSSTGLKKDKQKDRH